MLTVLSIFQFSGKVLFHLKDEIIPWHFVILGDQISKEWEILRMLTHCEKPRSLRPLTTRIGYDWYFHSCPKPETVRTERQNDASKLYLDKSELSDKDLTPTSRNTFRKCDVVIPRTRVQFSRPKGFKKHQIEIISADWLGRTTCFVARAL